MLTDHEKLILADCYDVLRMGFGEVSAMKLCTALTIIDRLTSPRAVLAEAERLLRDRKVYKIDIFHADYGAACDTTGVHSYLADGVTGSLADAYEALVDGKVGT